MAIKYESIVPWSRSYSEYVFMFGLNESDLSKSILGCGDGPASFNSVMYKKGKKVISVDIIYQFSIIEIKQRIKATFDIVMNQTRNNQEKFVWSNIKNIYELGLIRLSAMQEFLNDYEKGKIENRYVCVDLPVLPFNNNNFDLVLSSHFLFLYTNNLTLDFHIQSIAEMLRVAKEVRIFPLLDFNAIQSPYVEIIMNIYSKKGYSVKQLKVDYEFQKGGNKMLVIKQS
ncbi:MAG: SAM-dependent methyltransferase [Ignavibacteriaceae bacterium]